MAADTSQKEVHWQRTRSLMIVHLVIWFVFSYLVHWFAPQLNKISFMHFPLGFYMAAQGSLIVFVVLIWYLARAQQKIDDESGVAEEDA